jgi:hypothetical protein
MYTDFWWGQIVLILVGIAVVFAYLFWAGDK